MMRRTLILLLVFSFICVLPNFQALSKYDGKPLDENLNASSVPDHIVLTWTGDPVTTQTITWRTRRSVSRSFVQYKAFGAAGAGIVVEASGDTFTSVRTDAPGEFTVFSAELSGLKPGTRYAYSIIAGNTPGPWYTFTTAPATDEAFTFLVFGDSQSGEAENPDYSPWHNTITRAYERTPRTRFMVCTGDLVEIGQKYIHWNNWFDAAGDVIRRVPFMAAHGNHETFHVERSDISMPVYFTRQLKFPRNGPEGFKGQVYSFNYGDAHFVMLDSQHKEESRRYGDILTAQAAWLDRDLASSTAGWKLVFFHKPPYYNSVLRNNDIVRDAFVPVFDKNKVNVVFNGHDHCVARTYPIRNGKILKDSSEGTVYYLTGRSGAKSTNGVSIREWDAFFYNPVDQPCYLMVAVDKNMLKITTFRLDGSVIDSCAISKNRKR